MTLDELVNQKLRRIEELNAEAEVKRSACYKLVSEVAKESKRKLDVYVEKDLIVRVYDLTDYRLAFKSDYYVVEQWYPDCASWLSLSYPRKIDGKDSIREAIADFIVRYGAK